MNSHKLKRLKGKFAIASIWLRGVKTGPGLNRKAPTGAPWSLVRPVVGRSSTPRSQYCTQTNTNDFNTGCRAASLVQALVRLLDAPAHQGGQRRNVSPGLRGHHAKATCSAQQGRIRDLWPRTENSRNYGNREGPTGTHVISRNISSGDLRLTSTWGWSLTKRVQEKTLLPS